MKEMKEFKNPMRFSNNFSKPKLIRLSILIFALSFIVVVGEAGEKKLTSKAEKVMRSLMDKGGGQLEFKYKAFEIPNVLKAEIEDDVKQDFYRNEVDFWEIHRDGEVEGYALMDDVLGKQMPITFLVIFNKEGRITASRVLKYRERYGSGVRSKRWLRQFNERNFQSSFDVGKDIDAISGATISSNSVTRGIEKLTQLIAKLVVKKNQ
jgi:Na+-translocating ferredoxin:NAD+ oxidoreductase RnfG subunit